MPSVHLGELALQLGGLDAVLLGEVFLHVDGVLLLHNLIETLVSHDNRIQNRILVILELVLLQEGETLSRRDHHFAAGGLQLPGEDAQERGLAGAVGTDESVALPLGKLDIDILKQRLLADAQGNIGSTYHF